MKKDERKKPSEKQQKQFEKYLPENYVLVSDGMLEPGDLIFDSIPMKFRETRELHQDHVDYKHGYHQDPIPSPHVATYTAVARLYQPEEMLDLVRVELLSKKEMVGLVPKPVIADISRGYFVQLSEDFDCDAFIHTLTELAPGDSYRISHEKICREEYDRLEDFAGF